MRRLALSAVLSLTLACSPPAPPPAAEPEVPSGPTGAWLGQQLPGAEPSIFAPGFVSTGAYQRDLAWTPDGAQVFWSLFSFGERYGTILTATQGEDGGWSDPRILPMFAGHNSLEPFVTPDGQWLWFASQRPLPGEEEAGDWNLWRSPRTETGWGEPEALPSPVNGDGDEFYPSLTRDGLLVYTAQLEDSVGGEDLVASRFEADAWTEPVNLGENVNSPGPEFNSLIHPDGAWILFGSVREGDLGGGDLYIARSDGEGGWQPAEALPAPINSPSLDFCPSLSPDGTLLFFSSRRSTVEAASAPDASTLLERLEGPGNGQCDVYWVDASVLEVPSSGSAAE